MDEWKCAGRCGRRLMTRTEWLAVRGTPQARGFIKHGSRSMCDACLTWAKANGVTEDYPSRSVPLEVVAIEWAHLADREKSIIQNVRELAPRLGMSVGALDKAVYRLRRAEREQTAA